MNNKYDRRKKRRQCEDMAGTRGLFYWAVIIIVAHIFF